jgi:hypothetical protein
MDEAVAVTSDLPHALAGRTVPELDEHDLANLDADTVAARLVVDARATRAFTLTTRRPSLRSTMPTPAGPGRRPHPTPSVHPEPAMGSPEQAVPIGSRPDDPVSSGGASGVRPGVRPRCV